MNVSQNVTIDLVRPKRVVIPVTQEDSTRRIVLQLLNDGVPYIMGTGLISGETLLKCVEYRRADGTCGMYDTINNNPAVSQIGDAADGKWLVALDGVCFTVPGWTQINVRFYTETGKTLHSFGILADVHDTACPDESGGDSTRLESIADVKDAVDELQSDVQGLTSALQQETEVSSERYASLNRSIAQLESDTDTRLDAAESAIRNNNTAIENLDTTLQSLNSNAVRVTAQTFTNNQKSRARTNINAASKWTESAQLVVYDGFISETAGATKVVQKSDIIHFSSEEEVYPAIDCVVVGRNCVVGTIAKNAGENTYTITSTGTKLLFVYAEDVLFQSDWDVQTATVADALNALYEMIQDLKGG